MRSGNQPRRTAERVRLGASRDRWAGRGPGGAAHDEEREDGERLVLFRRIVLVVFPIIFLVGIVTMPAVSGAWPPWTAPTFGPASIALLLSGISFVLAGRGRLRAAVILYAAMFVAAPALAVIQDPDPTNLPIGTLMIGGALVISALFDEMWLPALFVAFVVCASLAIPLADPVVGIADAAALIAANLTNGAMVLTYSIHRAHRERRRRAALERTNKALREQQQLFSSFASNTPGILFRASAPPDRRLQYLSENFEAVTGLRREDYVGEAPQPFMDLVVAEDRVRLEDEIRSALQRRARYDVEYRIRNGDDEVRWLRETGRCVDDAEECRWIDSIAIDVTEARAKDDQLRQAQKMESVAMLAGGLAHDFNNILTIIMSSASLARSSVDERGVLDAAELDETLESVESASVRAKAMVDQLLALSRPQDPTMVPVDLVSAMKHVLKLLGGSLDKSIEISNETSVEHALVRADPVQIEQALLNLCVNAAHAMTIMRARDELWGGTLHVVLRGMAPDDHFIALHPEAESRAYWLLSVQDTGVGIDPDTRAQMFTPFFTTKEAGAGTGLGLSMVYSIVRSHGGFTTVYSEPGAGSTFNVFLPVLDEADARRTADVDGPRLVRGTGTILLVDDEEEVRKLAARILEECGYSVLTATNGAEALSRYGVLLNEVDLVVLDLVMPVLSGRETFHEMRRICPDLRVLLTSGFRQDSRVQTLVEAGVTGFLEKPYTLRTMSRAVAEALSVNRGR